MSQRPLLDGSAAAMLGAGLVFALLTPIDAATRLSYANPLTHKADCAVGAHVGPVGGCILGTDNPPPRDAVVVPPDNDNAGCETKSVTRSDAAGNSETKSKTNC